MKRHIPNTVTCLNLFSGCVGVVFALDGQLAYAAYCVVLAGVFDFLDGLVARALQVKSSIGKDLDSLADVVSFGLLPGALLYTMLQVAFPANGYLPYLGFVVTVCSALRLAKFNTDERQGTDFLGLATPMNAFYVVSLPFVAERFGGIGYHPLVLVGSIVVTSWLLVSDIRLFSLKLDSWSWQPNRWKFMFIGSSAALVALFQLASVPGILVLYFLFSYIHFKRQAA